MTRSGGEQVADALVAHGVINIFTLCGGHIAPILVAAKARGIRVIDTRDERSAAFAADAASRLRGGVGVAVVTAGPGVTNTITAIKNAQMAQSPLVLLGGATGTILEGRGALQDIDQRALLAPHVKHLERVRRLRDLVPAIDRAFFAARAGTPGPVFVECPVDLLYPESMVRDLYGMGPEAHPPRGLGPRLERAYLGHHLNRLFARGDAPPPASIVAPTPSPVSGHTLRRLARSLARAARPVLLVGSQAVLEPARVAAVARAVAALGVPVYLSGMARGLLGASHPCLLRHQRRKALAAADVVLLAGVACDFRLDYGRHIPRRATLLSINLDSCDLRKNRRPAIGVRAAPGRVLEALVAPLRAERAGAPPRASEGLEPWLDQLRANDAAREADIDRRAAAPGEFINPLAFFRQLDPLLDDRSLLVADGGDFVATASYTLRPRQPLRWLDPGVFGTLGVGGGFAVGAKASCPDAEIWLIWGDGSCAFSLAELDTCVRHGLGIISVVGNDGSWAQIAREQVEMLGDACGTELARCDYHRVAEGFGACGLLLERIEDTPAVLAEAQRVARSGRPVLVNLLLGSSDFRKGSISM